MKETTRGTVKSIVNFCSGAGASLIAGNIIAATTPIGIGAFAKVLIACGQLAIGMMAGERVGDYAGSKVDELFSNPEVVEEVKTEHIVV